MLDLNTQDNRSKVIERARAMRLDQGDLVDERNPPWVIYTDYLTETYVRVTYGTAVYTQYMVPNPYYFSSDDEVPDVLC